MGRLGFNLSHQKEDENLKKVEAGLATAVDQNENNEHVEIGELIITVEERNRQIKTLKSLLAFMSFLVFFLSLYILLTQFIFIRSDDTEIAEVQSAEGAIIYDSDKQALQQNYNVFEEENLEKLKNCTANAEATKNYLKKQLDLERDLRSSEEIEHHRRYEALQSSFVALQKKHEDASSQCRELESELRNELRKLGVERSDLVRKLETDRNLVNDLRSTSRSVVPIETSSSTQSTSAKKSTNNTTPKSTLRTFQEEQMKRINSFIKDVETGAVITNIMEFMKKADEVFRF